MAEWGSAGATRVGPEVSRSGPPGRRTEVRRSASRWGPAGSAALIATIALNVVNAAVFTGEFHWWANFVLVPGAALVVLGVALDERRTTRLILWWLGAIVLVVGFLLLLGRMGDGWPLLIAVPCVGPAALLALRIGDPSMAAVVRTVGLLSLLGVALGVTFEVFQLGLIEPGGHLWWVTYMFAAGAVPAANGAALLLIRRGGYWFSASVLLIAIGVVTILTSVRELQHWSM
jgi:hypothetical protein